MALTQGTWTTKSIGNHVHMMCNVAFTTAENDAYTLKTPAALDPKRPWTLIVTPAATADGSALPLDLWIGTDTDFALSGDGASVVATSGAEYKNICDDVSAATGRVISMDPEGRLADVTAIATGGLKIKVPIAPYYAFNLDGSTTLNATNCDFCIIQ